MASRDEQSEAFLNSDAIGDEFFIDIAEKKLNLTRDEFKLRLVLLSPATGKNENYVSVLYRAKIKVEILETHAMESIDVIIKALLTTLKEMKEFSVFPRERFVYENVLSSFEKIWLDRADEEVNFGPKSIKFETEPYEIIVLDDLKAAKFQMMDRKTGLNLEQTKMVLAKLAKFHAASAIRYQTDGIIHKDFDRKASAPPMTEDNPFFEGFLKIFEAFRDAIKSYGDCDVHAEKMAQWSKKKLFTMFLDIAEPMQCGFRILNHGDMWLNNMMFKFDEENNADEVALIDYQMSFWASPATDLLYFLLSSVADDIKVDHFDDFIDHYQEQLSESLKKLQYDQHIPTLPEIHIELLEKGYFACTVLMFTLFIVKYDSNEEISMEMLMSGGDAAMLDRIYKNDVYTKAVKLWLPFLKRRGYLDTMIVPEEAVTEEKKEE